MIEVRNLVKNFGNFTAVNNINFTIEKNEVVALLGLNGAGKTTTLRMLTGFLPPTQGSITIDNYSLFEQAMEAKKLIGYLPENPALYPDMNIREFLQYMYRCRKYTKENENEAIDIALQKTDLTNRQNDTIGTLSAGYKKRTGLAQAIVHNPSVLILDEPIADLDPVQIIEIRNLINELKKDHSILISTHILSEISQTADRYLILKDGNIIAQETPQSISEKNTDLESLFMNLTH